MAEINTLHSFDVHGDPTSVAANWKKWIRAFKLFVTAKNITNDSRKVALLLHTGGMDLQDIYYVLVGEEDEHTFEQCVQVLDQHFLPQSNESFERHLFRQMSQSVNETVDQFVHKLRRQAETCNFIDVDESIRDQLVEKCLDGELRKKFLEKSGKVTLNDFLSTARAHEAVCSQLKKMDISCQGTVNAVHPNKSYNNKKPMKFEKYGDQCEATANARRCYRCNKPGHFQRSPQCPARNFTCGKCGIKGHYTVVCKTSEDRIQKKKAYSIQVENGNNGNSVVDIESEYTFHISDLSNVNDGFINVTVGGVNLENVLIDSGASCNLIGQNTWNHLKQEGIKCQTKVISKKVYAYGQTEAMETMGTFQCNVKCDVTKLNCQDEFIVVKQNTRSILGKNTAEQLNVLRVGPPVPNVCTVATEGSGSDMIQKFPDIFKGVGKFKNFELDLHIDKTVKPVAQPVRRIPFGLRDKVDSKLDELIDSDIIEEVKGGPTEWVSPLVIVPKQNKDVRICVDMRRANQAIIRERHPIPTIEEVLYDMTGATIFSKLDLKWGFHQVMLSEKSRYITTFVTHRGLFRYKRLSFGINSAPEKYQKIVQDVLCGCQGVANIADDLIVYGCGMKEHDEHLNVVLSKLEEAGLTLNKSKCEFRLTKLTFFGHDLSKEGVSPSKEKVGAILEARHPETIAEIRSFLGLVQYCAKFIPNLAQIAEPLRKITRKDVNFLWGPEQEKAFAKLKTLMTRAETLAYFRNNCKTRIVADAGPTALGAVLTQLQDNVWRVIAYASRSLTEVERRYSQTEKEALALVWSCERFNLYVMGRSFELETDHKPLECIYSNTSKPCARIERWVLRLQGYDYRVVYRPGKTNIADALSRLNQRGNNVEEHGEEYDLVRNIVEAVTPISMTPKEIEIESDKDPELTSIRQYIQTGDWSSCKMTCYVNIRNELCNLGKLILRGTRLVIPSNLRTKVLMLAHEGHQGIVKTKERLRMKVWWPRMDADAEKMCKTCHSCQVVSNFNPPEPMQRTEPPTGPWQDLAIDLLGPLPSGESILVVVDYFSRFFEIAIMKSVTSQAVINVLRPIFARWGHPFSIKSDNGPQFVSEQFEEFLNKMGVEHRLSPPFWPMANGEVERQNRSLLKSLKISNLEGKNWRDELNDYLVAYRSTPHSSTGATPAFLMLGREIRTKLPELRPNLDVKYEGIREKDWENKISGKLYSDSKRGAIASQIQPGDKVLVKNFKDTGKLATNFEPSPFTSGKKRG